MHDHRLVDQLEAAFRLADRLDREGPERASGSESLQAHVDAQPLVDQAQALARRSGPAGVPSWPEALVLGVVEVAVVGPGGQAGEVELHGEVQRPVRRAGLPAGRRSPASSCRR